MKIFVIVPVFNEEKRAVDTIRKILINSKSNVIAIDDGSTDKSFQLLKKYFLKNKRVKLVKHRVNQGKGAAMKTGAEMAWKSEGEAVIFIDSDGQHNPKYLPIFEKKLTKHDYVFGYRKIGRKMPMIRKWGNIVAIKIVGFLFNIKRKDLLCGYMAMTKAGYNNVYWKSDRYGVETEIATKLGKKRLEFCEVKVNTLYLDKYKGVTIIDALKILLHIPVWYLER